MSRDDTREKWLSALGDKADRASWQGVVDLCATPEFRALLAGESESPAEGGPGRVSRRSLLKLVGASLALAGLGGCTPHEPEKILPYTRAPSFTPGKTRQYATSFVLDGYATGLVVESYTGRPIKVEGNPEHPASLGASGVYEQASVLGLYDPHRAKAVRERGAASTWDAFKARFVGARDDRGRGLRFLLPPTSSPLHRDLLRRVMERHPEARVTFWSPVHADHALEGARLAFGRRLATHYDFTKLEVVLALDADFLGCGPFSLRYAKDFAARHRPETPLGPMNRLYAVEAMFSPTGTLADHRLRKRPSEIARVAAAVAAELIHGLGRRPRGVSDAAVAALAPLRAQDDKAFIEALARDLARAGGASAVIVGERQPPIVHALGHLINAALDDGGAVGMTDPALITLEGSEQPFDALVDELRRGAVDTLVVLEQNPAYSAPADVDFASLLAKVPNTVCLSLFDDETAKACQWLVPAAHYLESWGDARAWDGTVSFVQPLVKPLFNGRTSSEVLAVFAGDGAPEARRLLRDYWQRESGRADFDAFWEEALRRGFLPDSAPAPQRPEPAWDGLTPELTKLAGAPKPGGLEIDLLVSPSVYDGRFADNAWLLELPRPISKLTWGNAAMMSRATAARLGVESGAIVELTLEGRKIELPAIVVPGHADDVVSVDLGYGRQGEEATARDVGVSAYRLRTSASPWFAVGLTLKPTGRSKALAITQTEFSEHERPLALTATLQTYRDNPEITKEHRGPVQSLLAPYGYSGDQWAMTIDQTICTGCSSCVVACQAENNVLVVGEEQVARGRAMHWLRIDQYLSGAPDEPEVVNQPMLCQHCEKAPCEYVCPVNATVHSPDGLNEMVYNRCVGTRFCSNNCPYKVRRFNYFDWSAHTPENAGLVKLQRNPDVTVRARGVMEKCTYCVQRIREAEIQSRIENRTIRPGEVVTACAQACPTGAIRFGSLQHEQTEMVAWRNLPRSYAVLHELGTEPRTQYLARIENPNPELEKA